MQEEKEVLRRRIFDMLLSKDHELRILGIHLAFEQGEKWCLYNLPPFGHVGLPGMDEYPDAIKVGSPPDDNTIYRKGNVGIMISAGYLQCRLIEQLGLDRKDSKRKKQYKIVEL